MMQPFKHQWRHSSQLRAQQGHTTGTPLKACAHELHGMSVHANNNCALAGPSKQFCAVTQAHHTAEELFTRQVCAVRRDKPIVAQTEQLAFHLECSLRHATPRHHPARLAIR